MFGGWIVTAGTDGSLSLADTVIEGIFCGLSALASIVFSGGGLVLGIVIGPVAFCFFRGRKNDERNEEA